MNTVVPIRMEAVDENKLHVYLCPRTWPKDKISFLRGKRYSECVEAEHCTFDSEFPSVIFVDVVAQRAGHSKPAQTKAPHYTAGVEFAPPE